MSKQVKMQPPVRLYETTIGGRLETLEQVQEMLAKLDDIRPGLRWTIKCRQTRQGKQPKEQPQKGRRMIP